MLEWNPSGERSIKPLVLLCQDRSGYLNLCHLLSRAYLDGQVHGYAPSLWEVMLGLGGCAMAAAITLVGLRALTCCRPAWRSADRPRGPCSVDGAQRRAVPEEDLSRYYVIIRSSPLCIWGTGQHFHAD